MDISIGYMVKLCQSLAGFVINVACFLTSLTSQWGKTKNVVQWIFKHLKYIKYYLENLLDFDCQGAKKNHFETFDLPKYVKY